MFDPVVAELEAEILRLRAIVEAQAALIEELRSRLEDLQAQIGRDSANSSLPPSRDRTDRRARRAAEAKQRRAANKALGQAARKPGKQPGTPGSTIERREPDRIVVHAPDTCTGCGASLHGDTCGGLGHPPGAGDPRAPPGGHRPCGAAPALCLLWV